MPNLPMHIYLADQVAEQLDRSYVFDHLGSYYLGSTAPDIRAMTKWPREQTHFAPLSVEEVGTGTKAMFRMHPELQEDMSPASRAFLAGYVGHLAADEVWITSVFRPYFDTAEDSRLTDDQIEANIWDRAMQLDLDRQALPQINGDSHPEKWLACSEHDVTMPFFEDGLLAEWKDRVGRFQVWEFTWDRLKGALNRLYRDDEDVQRTVEKFLEGMPRSLEQVYEKVPEAEVSAYQERALAATIAQVREFVPD
ncbi:MAG: zinc dependent phospholipase C family protein [Chloroflexi bacterium]|nr:zinc dependent phospholipase C family protein [Chloroflexota bacterium]